MLVTGAARRLGREIALTLARQGWDVAVHCRASRTEAEATASVIIAKKIALTRSEARPISKESSSDTASAAPTPSRPSAST